MLVNTVELNVLVKNKMAGDTKMIQKYLINYRTMKFDDEIINMFKDAMTKKAKIEE
jgi:hypothetical protein